MVSPLLIVFVVWALAYGHYHDTQKDVVTYHNSTKNAKAPPKVTYPEDLEPANLTANNITKITVTDNKGKAIATYNQDKGTATADTAHALSIKIKDTVGGEDGRETTDTTTAYFKKGPTNPDGAPNTITLTTTDGKTITITGKPITATVPYGHIFTEKFDTNAVHPHIVSPTLMLVVGMGHLIVTIFPPVIIAFLRLKGNVWSPQHNLRGSWGI
ncbi:uncharacterized protein TA09255 [Theileria annulata]|uniref:Tpr-related protein family member n=1 Tax=Theileria annulata TaxID=5874 RepID=Q4UAF6_THEAN|nr:uncharacterized protein TA09255 [Theileria annulata]CAI76195.1 hypothetical protein TA09255 [Theileria annulata]|eukprot:XP_952820.1 hypothetical protein TA09255 [Theileria annulata]